MKFSGMLSFTCGSSFTVPKQNPVVKDSPIPILDAVFTDVS
jgi:hypothetical protein